jgi:ATP-dependent RNA circularization protein (DNA/RNA ligase family)
VRDFFRFPHTPHIAWIGAGSPRDDKVLAPAEASALLAGDVVVEEKVDGANIGLSLGPDGAIHAQNRGQYLEQPYCGQFTRLSSWLAARAPRLSTALQEDIIVFGEWCAARHSTEYKALGDWFVMFDVYDRKAQRFWSTAKKNKLAKELEVAVVPMVFEGNATLDGLKKLVLTEPSRLGPPHLEGVVIRRENSDWLESRAKLVHPEFTQAITEHWSRRRLEWNQLAEKP